MISDQELTLIDHLEELRKRLWAVVLSVSIFSGISYFFSDKVLHYFALAVGPMVFFSPTEAFFIKLKIAVFGGIFLSLPVILFEIWRFIACALNAREKKMLGVAVPASYFLFAAGAALAVFAVAPNAMKMLLTFATADLKPVMRAGDCLSFVFFLSFAFGFLFQLPLAVFFLAKLGIVGSRDLEARRRMVYLGIFAAAAVMTPGPDIFSQILLALPTIFLYEISIWIVKWTCSQERVLAAESET